MSQAGNIYILHQFYCIQFYNTCIAGSMGGQDEANPEPSNCFSTGTVKFELSCLLGIACYPHSTIDPHNKSFIGHACSVKMAGYWPLSFLQVY